MNYLKNIKTLKDFKIDSAKRVLQEYTETGQDKLDTDSNEADTTQIETAIDIINGKER